MTPTAPCSTCPWRRSSTEGGFDIPTFSIEKMRGLAVCFPPEGVDEDGMRPVMACHGSACGAETPCVGYLAVEGWRNINVRLLAVDGSIDMQAILAACEAIDLWPDFHSMLEAYEQARQLDPPCDLIGKFCAEQAHWRGRRHTVNGVPCHPGEYPAPASSPATPADTGTQQT